MFAGIVENAGRVLFFQEPKLDCELALPFADGEGLEAGSLVSEQLPYLREDSDGKLPSTFWRKPGRPTGQGVRRQFGQPERSLPTERNGERFVTRHVDAQKSRCLRNGENLYSEVKVPPIALSIRDKGCIAVDGCS